MVNPLHLSYSSRVQFAAIPPYPPASQIAPVSMHLMQLMITSLSPSLPNSLLPHAPSLSLTTLPRVETLSLTNPPSLIKSPPLLSLLYYIYTLTNTVPQRASFSLCTSFSLLKLSNFLYTQFRWQPRSS